MTECTALPSRQQQSTPVLDSILSENIIEDFFSFNNDPGDIWPSQDQHQVSTKKRLSSYEESLSSPDSQFSSSNRSRVSSGEDDLEIWRPGPGAVTVQDDALKLAPIEFDPSLTELNAILDGTRMDFGQVQQSQQHQAQLEWTYLEPAQPGFDVNIPSNPTSTGYNPSWELSNAYPDSPAVVVQPLWPVTSSVCGHTIHINEATNVMNFELIDTIPTTKSSKIIARPRSNLTRSSVKASSHKKAEKSAVANLRICHVCGEMAGKHSYYGGQVCPSCRAFFRRSVQSKYSDIYKCSKGGSCVVTLKTRKNCQFCRFQACEKAGMKRSWVLADGEVKGKKASSPAVSTSSSSSSSSLVPNSSAMCSSLSTHDENKIRDCIEKMQTIKQQTEDLNPQVMEEFIALVKKRHSQLSKESRCAMKKVLEQRSRLLALSVPEFTSLTSNDQVVLQEENLGPLIELRIATFFHTEIKARQQVDLILGPADVLRVTSSLAGMHNLDKEHLEYEQFFNEQDEKFRHSNDFEGESEQKKARLLMAQHKSLIQKISKWVEDETTFCLMNLILLFNASESGKQLDSPDLVENYQIYYAQLLYRYLLSRYPKSKARAKLAEGIRVISHCRELHNLTKNRCNSANNRRSSSESSHLSTTSSGACSEDN